MNEPKCCSSKYLFLDNLKVLNRISPGMSPSPSTSSWLRFSASGSVKVVFESWNQYSVSGGRSSLLNWTEFRHHSTHTSPPSAHPRKTSIPTFQTWNSVPWKSDQHLHCYSRQWLHACRHKPSNKRSCDSQKALTTPCIFSTSHRNWSKVRLGNWSVGCYQRAPDTCFDMTQKM